MEDRNGSRTHRVTAYAPGTVSNLGPGFDCLGAAIEGRGDRVTAERTSTPGVWVEWVSDGRIPVDAHRNTAGIAATEVLSRAGGAGGLSLRIQKGLPLAGGLGGSAASAVAGAVAANAALGGGLSQEQLLQAALAAECVVAGRHADNVAPALLGGVVLVLSLDPLRVTQVTVHPSLALVIASPAYEVETVAARSVLPQSVSLAAAVGQAANLAGLLLAIERGDGELLRSAMRDFIVEPARAELYPGHREARRAALDAGAFGAAVSGGGPTLLAMAPSGSAGAICSAVASAFDAAGHPSVCFVTRIDSKGARLLDEQG